jgi:hypothetical protein
LWFPKNDLQDSSSWSSPPLLFLRDIHSNLLFDNRYTETSSQSQVNVGSSGGLSSQGGVSHHQEPVPLSIPEVNHLFEASFVWDESSVSNVVVTVIPSHHRVTQQMLSHCQTFRDLKPMFVGSRLAEQSSLRSQQSIVVNVEDSLLRTEMTRLESQEEDAPECIIFFKTMS